MDAAVDLSLLLGKIALLLVNSRIILDSRLDLRLSR
jgi:hypothetical protein